MLNLKENRDRLIQRAIRSIKPHQELLESLDSVKETNFEYEPSEIICALFEETVSPKKFRDRKLQGLQESESKEKTFFPNSSKYLKKRKTQNQGEVNDK